MLVLYFVIGTNWQAVIKLGLSLPETIINVGIHDPKRHVYVQVHTTYQRNLMNNPFL